MTCSLLNPKVFSSVTIIVKASTILHFCVFSLSFWERLMLMFPDLRPFSLLSLEALGVQTARGTCPQIHICSSTLLQPLACLVSYFRIKSFSRAVKSQLLSQFQYNLDNYLSKPSHLILDYSLKLCCPHKIQNQFINFHRKIFFLLLVYIFDQDCIKSVDQYGRVSPSSQC